MVFKKGHIPTNKGITGVVKNTPEMILRRRKSLMRKDILDHSIISKSFYAI